MSQVEVYSITVDCTVTSRFAHTVMTSKALNKANTSQEIFFEVELPKTAFISNFSMSVKTLCLWLCFSLHQGPLFLCVSQISLLLTGKLMVRCMLGRLRRKKKPRTSMRKLFPLEKLLDWSSIGLKHAARCGSGGKIKLQSCISIITGLPEERWRNFQCLLTLRPKAAWILSWRTRSSFTGNWATMRFWLELNLSNLCKSFRWNTLSSFISFNSDWFRRCWRVAQFSLTLGMQSVRNLCWH